MYDKVCMIAMIAMYGKVCMIAMIPMYDKVDSQRLKDKLHFRFTFTNW